MKKFGKEKMDECNAYDVKYKRMAWVLLLCRTNFSLYGNAWKFILHSSQGIENTKILLSISGKMVHEYHLYLF